MKSPLPALLIAAFICAQAPAAAIDTAVVEANGAAGVYVADGTVEAVRQSVLAAQVPGRVTALAVRAGDTMKSGQVLARIDERAAVQQAAASEAQVAAAQAQLEAARREYERSQRLHQKQYISQAAMDQAEAQFKANQAQANASLAQARAVMSDASLRTLTAPYSGIVAAVSAEVGDMALPGKPLITVYDPSALRVVVNVAESYAAALDRGAPVKIELAGTADGRRVVTAQRVTVLPTSDPASHTIEIRLALPASLGPLAPGSFARVHLPLTGTRGGSLTIPVTAVVTRTELRAVYVATADGKFQLRQVRLGRTSGDRVEVLAGLQAGERIALDPVAAGTR